MAGAVFLLLCGVIAAGAFRMARGWDEEQGPPLASWRTVSQATSYFAAGERHGIAKLVEAFYRHMDELPQAP